jgi:hypothetical protein
MTIKGSAFHFYRSRGKAIALLLALVFSAAASVGSAAQTLVAPDSLRQGDPLLCWIASPLPLSGTKAVLRNSQERILYRTSAFYMSPLDQNSLYGILIPIDVRDSPGNVTLEVVGEKVSPEGSEHFNLTKTITIDKKEFPFEEIPLDKSNTDILSVPDPAKTAEAISFSKLFETSDPTSIFLESEIDRPLAPWRQTAAFGEVREYKYYNGKSERSVHGGIDLGAKMGTDVIACAPGRIAFEGKRIVTGNTIVIEHLPGLFSIYMHLSKFDAAEGDIVEMGQKIGEVGSTGLSTGPHLHWEMRIGLTSVDPEYWITHMPLDKDAIIRKISSAIEGR